MLKYLLLSVCLVLAQLNVAVAKPKLLVPRLQPRGVEKHEAKTISTALCHAVSKLKTHEVLCSDDLEAMVTWNARAAQLNACRKDDCLAQAAAAMQAKQVFTGSLAKVESDYVLSIALLDVRTGKVAKRAELKKADLSKLYDGVAQVARELLGEK